VGIRPTATVFEKQPSDPWDHADFRLLEAYQILQDETCGNCGHPLWLCRNPDVFWEVRTDLCAAEKEIESWHKKQTKEKPGVHPRTVPYVLSSDERGVMSPDYDNLPSRADFFKLED